VWCSRSFLLLVSAAALCGLCRPDHEALKQAFPGPKGLLKEGGTSIEFRILGSLEAVEDGRQVPLGGSKQRGLLALLLLHANQVVSRDRLIDELWDGSPPETASTALQVHVSGLRKALGREAIATQAPGYKAVVLPGALDLELFEALVARARGDDAERSAELLREALDLWRGPALADLDDSIGRTERAQLEEQRAAAVEQRIDAELELGRHAELLPELEALVREDPLRERRRAQLMLALYRSGRQAEALEVYRGGRKLLADELGLEPGEELRRLEKAILEQDPSLAAPPAPPTRVAEVERELRRRRPWALAVALGVLLLIAAVAAGIVLGLRNSTAVVVQPNSVAAVDDHSGKVLADVPIGGRPVAIALGAGSVWVVDADHSTLSRIDEQTKERLPIGGLGSDLSDVAYGFGSVWVAGGNDGTLVRLDPQHNGAEQIDLGESRGSPQPVFSVRVGAGMVWATQGNDVLRIDPDRNEVTGRRTVTEPQGIAPGLDSLWVTTLDERILRIDARTMKPVYAQDVSHVCYFPLVAAGSLWVVATPNLSSNVPEVWRLDPGTLAQEHGFPLPKRFPYQLAGGSGAVWSVDPGNGALWRFDADTNRVLQFARLAHHPVSLAVGDGTIWVGTQAEPLS
jgi:DNA-binding SARP family transcriptional activator/streptogramin lyase